MEKDLTVCLKYVSIFFQDTKLIEKLLFIKYLDLKAWDLLVFFVQAVMHLADSLINATVR